MKTRTRTREEQTSFRRLGHLFDRTPRVKQTEDGPEKNAILQSQEVHVL